MQGRDGIARWRRVEDDLAREIVQGAIGAGERLPSEADLAARFSVHRHTVRRALAQLAARGLVRAEHGRGTFVRDVVLDYPLRRRTSFSANLLAQDRTPSHTVLDVRADAADVDAAAALEVTFGDPVALTTALGLANDVPITFSRSVLPLARLPGVIEALERESSMSRVYAAAGILGFSRRSTRITARMPTDDEAAQLRQAASEPVLVTEAVDIDQDGRPIRYGISCFAAARVQISVDPDG